MNPATLFGYNRSQNGHRPIRPIRPIPPIPIQTPEFRLLNSEGLM